ncbi:hypothetical protein BSLG_006387 [Batrachochytrium salamandrivorans]|nr:hypothetical protein BSLG_006387 [Batrachochytrium salamandrivorans]
MNIFQLMGDMLHLASIIILLLKIQTSRSAAGKMYCPLAHFCDAHAWVEFLLGGAAVLALLVHYHGLDYFEIVWAFSIYLESVAILPQLFQLSRTGEAETITTHYLMALGGYRFFYILNWIYKYNTNPKFHDWIPILPGIIQTALYLDFFYVYFTKVVRGQKFRLPA